MTQEQNDLLLKDLCARVPYGVKVKGKIPINQNEYKEIVGQVTSVHYNISIVQVEGFDVISDYSPHFEIKPYLFPLSSMTDEDHAIYLKIWEDTGKAAYLEGCHHLISTIKAYKAANDYLLSKHYDINGLIPMELALDATELNIY